MSLSRRPLFLERQSYRRRRLVDASRLIPVFGLFLFMVPLLWADAGAKPPNLAARGVYIFVVWLALVLATALISHRLKGRGGGPLGAEPPQPQSGDLDGAGSGVGMGAGGDRHDDVL